MEMKLLPMSAKCNSGISYVFVASVFKVNQTGALIESSKSEPITVAVPDTYALPLYDDFDSGTTETNYWTKEIQLEIRVMGIGTLSFIVALSIKVCILQ